jgi:hypothetical protein
VRIATASFSGKQLVVAVEAVANEIFGKIPKESFRVITVPRLLILEQNAAIFFVLTAHTTINTMSATVSDFEPKLLTALVFLAIAPSIISLKPQSKYVI